MKPFWIIGNVYGKVMGWNFFAPMHHALINLCLHALGYGNMYFSSSSGEEWFLKKVLKKTNPKIVFDIGANVGNYSKSLLSETEAKIYAFEPNPDSFTELQKLPEQVEKIQCAVSNEPGNAFLHFRGEHDERASLSDKVRIGEKVEVTVETVSDIASERNISEVDFIKIDTEGFEKEVIEGFGGIRPKFVQFEFNINHLQRDVSLLSIVNLLPEYEFYRLLPNGWIKINPKKYLNNIYMFSNVIAVRLN